jgi:hypothetical protein
MKFLNFAKGWKTYATVAVGISLGLYQWYTGHDVPSYAYMILGFAGLGFHRSALQGETQATAEAVSGLITDVLSQVTTTAPQEPLQTISVPGGTQVTLGKPTPPGASEEAVTAALNSAQVH